MRFIPIDEKSYYAMMSLSNYHYETHHTGEVAHYDVIADAFQAVMLIYSDESGAHASYFVIMNGDVPDPITRAMQAEILGIPIEKLPDLPKEAKLSLPGDRRKINNIRAINIKN